MADKAMLTNRIVLRSIMPLFKILHEEDDTLLKHFLTRFEGVSRSKARTSAHISN